MIPVGDYPNPPRAQWVTRILIGLNVAVYLFISVPLSGQHYTTTELGDPDTAHVLAAMWEWQKPEMQRRGVTQAEFYRSIDKYSVFTFRYGYRPSSPSLLALLFCMFLHGGFSHLAGNMLFLWIYGDNVEYRLGPIQYVLWYLGTGVAATLTFAFLDSTSLAPLIGASGAISGILGFYLIWFPHNYVKVFFFFPFFGFFLMKFFNMSGYSGCFRHIGEGAITVIAKQPVGDFDAFFFRCNIAYVQIKIAIAIIITPGGPVRH